MTSTPTSLTALQRFNLSYLQLIRDAALVDRASACCCFGISVADADALVNMPGDAVLDTVVQVGQEPLFVPREGLHSFLQAPASVVTLVAASSPLRAGSRRPADRAAERAAA